MLGRDTVRGRGATPPAVPPLPRPSLLARRGRTRFGHPLEVNAVEPAPAKGSPRASLPSDADDRPAHNVSGEKPTAQRYPPTQAKKKGYHWDDYDLRGSRTLVGDGAHAATPDLLLLPRDALPPFGHPDDDPPEGRPLLARSHQPGVIRGPVEENAATPLLSIDVREDVHPIADYDDDNEDDDDDDDPCSFEEILLANNISLGSSCDLDHATKYNIVSDLEEEIPEPEVKIFNVPFPREEEDTSRLGSPRSRRPFLRADYGRVSDLSFLSALEEDGVDDSLSELQDSDYDPGEPPDPKQTATLIQTSTSEVFL